MAAERARKDTWRAEGYMGDPFKGFEARVNEDDEQEWPVTYWVYSPPLVVYIGASMLAEAGITPVNGRIVIADIKKGAITADEVNPSNLEDGGVLPGLDEEYTWLQPKSAPVE